MLALAKNLSPEECFSHRPFRIGIVTETYPPEVNGVANTVKQFVSGMLLKGHEVNLVRPCQKKNDKPEIQSRYSEILVKGIQLPMYKSMRIGLPLPDTLWRHWKKSMPDVVYISTEGPLGFAALLTANKLSIPVVSGFHTNFDYYTRFYHLAVIEKMVMRYLRFFHSRSGQTLVPTEQLKKQLLNKGIQNTIVSPRGIDIDRFNPDYHNLALRRQWGVTADGLAVILVGRLAAEKNLDLAVRAFRKIQKIKPESRFILVGDGPLAGAIKKENPDFIFAGQKTGEELATHYASADLFLFPSQSETFGNVVLEALASGLPVVGYDYAAAAEHVVSGSNGFKAPFDQESAFILAAEKAAHAAKNSRLKEMRKQARWSVETESWERLLVRFESILIEESHYDEHFATAW